MDEQSQTTTGLLHYNWVSRDGTVPSSSSATIWQAPGTRQIDGSSGFTTPAGHYNINFKQWRSLHQVTITQASKRMVKEFLLVIPKCLTR